ncbi:MAG TPA: acyl carrier protein [Isosphaeraceae bacterium]|nr:acyl carrier protein [Isosphaeraceae bacterium]
MPGAPCCTTASNQPCQADPRSRLVQCFAAAFPNLEAEAIPRAAAATLPEWDSLASMTLLGLIEEEFQLRVPAADIPRLTSFSVILNYIDNIVVRGDNYVASPIKG